MLVRSVARWESIVPVLGQRSVCARQAYPPPPPAHDPDAHLSDYLTQGWLSTPASTKYTWVSLSPHDTNIDFLQMILMITVFALRP